MAEIGAEGLAASARAGARSQFDVIVDGHTIFSKAQTGRFPLPGEIVRLLSG